MHGSHNNIVGGACDKILWKLSLQIFDKLSSVTDLYFELKDPVKANLFQWRGPSVGIPHDIHKQHNSIIYHPRNSQVSILRKKIVW